MRNYRIHTDVSVTTVFRRVHAEVRLMFGFISGDVSSTIIPASLMTLAAWKAAGREWSSLPLDLARAIIYFTAYIYMFCLSNQLIDVAEDRINKPHRPLVQQRVSLQGAQYRLGIVIIVFIGLGFVWNVSSWTFLWIAATLLHNQAGLSRHWLGKHLVMSIGVIAQLAAAWSMVLPLTELAWRWISTIAWLVFPLITIQDLRDIEGDRVLGRRTIPLVWNQRWVRFALSGLLLLLPFFLHYSLFKPFEQRWIVLTCEGIVASMAWILAYRVVARQSIHADHHSYLLFTYWYCMMLVSMVCVV
ncbi:MAG: UbiA family prenyltransferase [Herpetosiphon sp.]|nr:UbiA family prenyltransferase [Herpetosiphon sp.]